MRERFRDAAPGGVGTYEWTVGHYEEQGRDRRHNIERSAPTSNVGFVRQQGEASPTLLRFEGTILTVEQYDKFNAFFDACRTRTIFYRDYTGVEVEVLITHFDPRRVAVVQNPRDPSIMHYWRYTIEMEVIS